MTRPFSMLLAAVVIAVSVGLATCTGFAATPAECLTADVGQNTFPLPRTMKAIANKNLHILVLGAGSSALPGAGGANNSYPARLQQALKEKFPDTAVQVATDVKPGRTAADMVKILKPALTSAKPDLLIWQTGTVDAVRGVDPDQFNSTLFEGLAIARSTSIDTVLMNMQFSPRTESMIALTNYAEAMRWVALQHSIPLFDRFQIMKIWNDQGTFDLYTATKNLDVAVRVHDCIGRLLADLIAEAATSGDKPAEIR